MRAPIRNPVLLGALLIAVAALSIALLLRRSAGDARGSSAARAPERIDPSEPIEVAEPRAPASEVPPQPRAASVPEEDAVTTAGPAPEQRRAAAPSTGAQRVDVRVRVCSEEDGRPVADIPVVLSSGGELLECANTDARGLARLRGSVASGSVELVVAAPRLPQGWFLPLHVAVLDPERADGVERVFVARPWPPPVAGEIRGLLRSESGRFDDLEPLLAGGVLLDLVSETDADELPGAGRSTAAPAPRVQLASAQLVPRELADGEQVLEFVFADVPAGRYELTLSSLLPFRWEPPRRFVVPPQSGLEFMRMDGERSTRLAFRVLDDATGEPVGGWTAWHVRQSESETSGVYLHAGPIELERGASAEHWNWSVWAPDYAPAFGDERAFDQRQDDGTCVATVHLRRGWATRVVVLGRDPTMRPMAGVPILLDGRFAARTDASGSATVSAAALPAELTVDLAGFTVERVTLLASSDPRAQRRGHVTPVVLRRVE